MPPRAITAPVPAGFKVLCSSCGEPRDVGDFGPAQLKKKHPRCRVCAPNKFSNQRAGAHQSKRESRRSRELHTLEIAGLIHDLREQVAYELIPAQRDEQGKVIERACTYIADFVYTDSLGLVHVEDAKGMRTEKYTLKRKLMLHTHNIRIEEV